MTNAHNRTRRIIERRKEQDNRAERAARCDKQRRLAKIRQRELEQSQ